MGMTRIAFVLFAVILFCAFGLVTVPEATNFDVTVWQGDTMIRQFRCWTFADDYQGIRFYTQSGRELAPVRYADGQGVEIYTIIGKGKL
jgi:hypothetical protein